MGAGQSAEPVEHSGLDDHHRDHANDDQQQVVDNRAEIHRQADRHEEQRQQDAAERLDIRFQLVPVGGFGQ